MKYSGLPEKRNRQVRDNRDFVIKTNKEIFSSFKNLNDFLTNPPFPKELANTSYIEHVENTLKENANREDSNTNNIHLTCKLHLAKMFKTYFHIQEIVNVSKGRNNSNNGCFLPNLFLKTAN